MNEDHLGSFTCVTNEQGNIVEEYAYDAWGKRRNAGNWSAQDIDATAFFIDRGFTGHEHLDHFGLINMNGRIYDPLLGRMLSPDKYVQAPGFTQSFNRYSYCGNNPLVYIDPTGQNFYKLFDLILGPGMTDLTMKVTTISLQSTLSAIDMSVSFTRSLMEFHIANMNAVDMDIVNGKPKFSVDKRQLKDNLALLDPTNDNNAIGRAAMIETGLFLGAPYEIEQNLMGNAISHYRNLAGDIDQVEVGFEDGYGYVLVNDASSNDRWGITLGTYVNTSGVNEDYTNDALFVHEFGHVAQSKMLGPAYMGLVGEPSLTSELIDDYPSLNHNHGEAWFEVGATYIGDQAFPGVITARPTSVGDIDWWWFILYFNPFIY